MAGESDGLHEPKEKVRCETLRYSSQKDRKAIDHFLGTHLKDMKSLQLDSEGRIKTIAFEGIAYKVKY
jgi:hypothetical protein